ncbi:MAG: 4Fe-4S dicluster domain-containing protein [Veillonella sp.]|uniref:indolepyruvate ferredoxin oxidoreductase subunit alpha n=1 Tax=Veillonella sp. TaxID=1926307 RepID=UPI0025D3AD02|nr:4Fe-4S binding protein [Veillonella sp.]MBE6080200.1 4Fe-4S dicluster domain-containing protein [Veillonella sp.]
MSGKSDDVAGIQSGVNWRFVVNGERCVKCGACAMDCPVRIIVEQPHQFFIGNGCIGCGDCYEICPVGAIERVKK